MDLTPGNSFTPCFSIDEDLNVSGMVKNRKLARVISQQGWPEYWTLIESKAAKFGRDFRVISRWEPTSQECSNCGFKWGKIDLSVRSILCLGCGLFHDRDENASVNIEQVGMGYRHDSKCASRDCKTTRGSKTKWSVKNPHAFRLGSISIQL